MASLHSPEEPFCESPPLRSSSKLSLSLWIPITVAVEGGLKTRREHNHPSSSCRFCCVNYWSDGPTNKRREYKSREKPINVGFEGINYTSVPCIMHNSWLPPPNSQCLTKQRPTVSILQPEECLQRTTKIYVQITAQPERKIHLTNIFSSLECLTGEILRQPVWQFSYFGFQGCSAWIYFCVRQASIKNSTAVN